MKRLLAALLLGTSCTAAPVPDQPLTPSPGSALEGSPRSAAAALGTSVPVTSEAGGAPQAGPTSADPSPAAPEAAGSEAVGSEAAAQTSSNPPSAEALPPAGPPAGDAPPPAEVFELVAHHDLRARGMNAGLAVLGDHAYVGGRGDGQGVAVLRRQEARLEWLREIPPRSGATARELRVAAEQQVLVVMSYALRSGGFNGLDVYSLAEPGRPRLLATVDLGLSRPHEFFLAPGPTAWLAMSSGPADLEIVDLSHPAEPVRLRSWGSPRRRGPEEVFLHSLSLDRSGRVYAAWWDGGLEILDSDLGTLGRLQSPELGSTHTAAPYGEWVILTQEVYHPGCPFGWLRTVDASDPARPRLAGELRLAENRCGGPPGTFSAHNPLAVGEVVFVTWHGAGLVVADLSRPADPRLVGRFVPAPLGKVKQEDPRFGPFPVQMWSYPILHEGLLYVVDVRNGLYVLRYTGPGANDLAAVGWAEGNSLLGP